ISSPEFQKCRLLFRSPGPVPAPQVRARFLGAKPGHRTQEGMSGAPLLAAKAGIRHCQEPSRSSLLLSSHFSRTPITDLHHSRCEDTPTVHHRELRQSPETNAFPASNFLRAL